MFSVVDPEFFFFREFLLPDRSFSFYAFYGFAESGEKLCPVGGCNNNVYYVFSGFDDACFVVDQDFKDAFFLFEFFPDSVKRF